MFLGFEMRMLLSLPTTVATPKPFKGWIIGLDSPDFPITAQLYLATGLWRFQSERLAVARNHSSHPKLSFDDKYLLN